MCEKEQWKLEKVGMEAEIKELKKRLSMYEWCGEVRSGDYDLFFYRIIFSPSSMLLKLSRL